MHSGGQNKNDGLYDVSNGTWACRGQKVTVGNFRRSARDDLTERANDVSRLVEVKVSKMSEDKLLDLLDGKQPSDDRELLLELCVLVVTLLANVLKHCLKDTRATSEFDLQVQVAGKCIVIVIARRLQGHDIAA